MIKIKYISKGPDSNLTGYMVFLIRRVGIMVSRIEYSQTLECCTPLTDPLILDLYLLPIIIITEF